MAEAGTREGVAAWTGFYEEVAEKLLDYRDNRTPLIEALRRIASTNPAVNDLEGDRLSPKITAPLRDICPFTTIGTFNRNIKSEHRHSMASGLARFLRVRAAVPADFGDVEAPTVPPLKAWFFPFAEKRGKGDIDSLWAVFAAAHELRDQPNERRARENFIATYDKAKQVKQVAWNLSMGLYWSHPWSYPTLDQKSRAYLKGRLRIELPSQAPDGKRYADLINELKALFARDDCPVHSFPELSCAAYRWSPEKEPPEPGTLTEHEPPQPEPRGERVLVLFRTEDGNWLANTAVNEQRLPTTADHGEISRHADKSDVLDKVRDLLKLPKAAPEQRKQPPEPPGGTYDVDSIVTDGCFLDRQRIQSLLERLQDKKNLILQGPPGTGKTWLGRRLAYALVGWKDPQRVRAVQFHPNLSYEDFVRGYRPSSEGRLDPVDGVFMQVVRAALAESESDFALVIEEINRGNPAQIFGELLTLLEADKRKPDEALELPYPEPGGKSNPPVHIPPNLYVVGTMNLADRSLALVDFALRRRFAFADLEPQLGAKWLEWIVENRGVDRELARDIQQRMTTLNAAIEEEESLGPQFRLGHSYVTPSAPLDGGTREWFEQVARTEIGPQLEEYWFDSPQKAHEQLEDLLKDW